MLFDARSFFFFFNDTATTEIYTLSLHDALPILGIGSNTAVFSLIDALLLRSLAVPAPRELVHISFGPPGTKESEEHTSELQSRLHLVCRLLLEKKKKSIYHNMRMQYFT